MEAWLEFGRGPLFRLALALMLLGLLRLVLLDIVSLAEALRRSQDRIVAWNQVWKTTFSWLFPVGRLWKMRPVYSAVSFVFHAGLLLVPPFLAAHILLWKRGAGVAWPALPQSANWLTVATVVAAAGLIIGRIAHRGSRSLSRFQDYAWPVLLALPFISGYICTNVATAPRVYQWLMLIHVLSADVIMIAIPFTKIAHCALMPLSQAVTAVAWKFPAGAGDRVAATLGFGDRPTWVEKPRLGLPERPAECQKSEVAAQ